MNFKNAVWLKIFGVCGITAPIIAFACIFLAIANYPQYSWTENSLSDLGGQGGISAILFNSGLICAGILAFVFTLGLFQFLTQDSLGKIGVFILVLAALTLILIGIFPEHVKPIHYYVSVAFFIFIPSSMLLIGSAFLRTARTKLGLFTFLTATIAVVVWFIHFSKSFFSDVAIPETVSTLFASLWFVVLGIKSLKRASH